MKKIAIASALLVVGVGMLAAQTEVTSVNVVGYTKFTAASNKYYMVCYPFYVMSTNYSIQSVISNQLVGGTSSTDSDQLIVYNNSLGSYSGGYNWFKASDQAWHLGMGVSTTPVNRGFCAWVKCNASTNGPRNLTFMGQVVPSSTITQVVYVGYNMMAYPFNVDVNVTNTALDAVAVGGTASTGDQIIKWNVAGQSYEYYWKELSTGKWKKGMGYVSPDFKMGEAFWFQRRAGGGSQWVETAPYTL